MEIDGSLEPGLHSFGETWLGFLFLGSLVFVNERVSGCMGLLLDLVAFEDLAGLGTSVKCLVGICCGGLLFLKLELGFAFCLFVAGANRGREYVLLGFP